MLFFRVLEKQPHFLWAEQISTQSFQFPKWLLKDFSSVTTERNRWESDYENARLSSSITTRHITETVFPLTRNLTSHVQ